MLDARRGMRGLLGASAIAIAVHCLPAAAQSAPDAQVQPPKADAATSDQGDIVVTAMKRSEDVQKVPAQVNVVNSDTIERLHATNIADIGAYVPGLQVASGGTPGQTVLALRGIAPLGPAATVASYIDETPVGSSSINASGSSTGVAFSVDLLPTEVERIEVLQGPQGTLYGANAIGGLVKYVLRTPSLDRLQVEAGADLMGVRGGSKAGGGGYVRVSVPLIKDTLAVSGSYASESTPGYIDNSQTGERDQNSGRQQSARAALIWKPASNFTLKLGFLWQKSTAEGNSSVALDPVTLKPLGGDLTDNNYIPQTSDISLRHYSAQVNWDLGFANLVSATSFSQSRAVLFEDSTRSIGPVCPFFGIADFCLAPYRQLLSTRKFTQEVRLASPASNVFEWQIGGFYTNERTQDDQWERAELADGTPIPGVDPFFHAQLPDTYKEYAVFGDLTLHLTKRLDISGGGRYAHNRQYFPITSTGFLTGDAAVSGRSSEGVFTYSVGPRFQITDSILLYGRYATGYQAGGPNIPFPGVPATVKSDTTSNIEVGLKTQFWQKRGTLNLTVFDIDWKNIQLLGFQEGTGFSYIANGGKARSRGVSLDGSIRPVDGLTLAGNVTYTDSILSEDVPLLGGRSGDKLPYIPTWSGSLQADYEWKLASDWKATLSAGARLVGKRFNSVESNPNAFPIAGYAAVDMGASLTYRNYTMRFFAKNAFDRRAYNYNFLVSNALDGSTTQIESTPIQPRTIGVVFSLKY